MGTIIEAIEAGFSINGQPLLKEITMEIEDGAAIAITGANGSGKSSLIKLLAGMSEPQRGEVRRNFSSYAYVPEHFPEHLSFTVRRYLALLAEMGTSAEAVSVYTRMFDLDPFLDTPLKKCSKGTKQKAGFIQALLKNGDVLFLDEPFTGMDEKAIRTAVDLLRQQKGKKTIIFAVHETELAAELATHAAVLDNGRLLSLSPVQPTARTMEITYEMDENKLGATPVAERIYRIMAEEAVSDQRIGDILKHGGHIIGVKKGDQR